MNFFKQDPKIGGTKGLVYIGNDVLIYRRDAKAPYSALTLDVPGGGAEPGETPFEVFRREVKEEFNLEVQKDDIVYSRRYPSTVDEGLFVWYTVAKLPSSAKAKIVFGNEGVEYFLMPLQKFLSAKDAWPVYQQQAAEYAKSAGLD